MADIAPPKRVPLNESADLQLPLLGCVICCTSVPDEKRVSLSISHAGFHPKATTSFLTLLSYNRQKLRNGQIKWVQYIVTT